LPIDVDHRHTGNKTVGSVLEDLARQMQCGRSGSGKGQRQGAAVAAAATALFNLQ
jgi:hypothetical protein